MGMRKKSRVAGPARAGRRSGRTAFAPSQKCCTVCCFPWLNTYERRHKLFEILRKQPGARVPELAGSLGVSEGTVRNDLNALEADGRLKRFHGGAVLREKTEFQCTSFSIRHKEHSAEKILISRHAAELVNDGDSILVDASSTAYFFALAIQDRQRLRVVTNGLDVARLLSQNPTNTVILIGGVLNTGWIFCHRPVQRADHPGTAYSESICFLQRVSAWKEA
jgi:DeoR/GlpR family transcriptional regulator of sugar metabolism